MERIVEFATNHWLLVLGLIAVAVAIVVNEIILLLGGRGAVAPEDATRLYNRDDAVFVDVRGENAFHTSHLPGAVNVPLERLEQQLDRLRGYDGRPVIVYGDTADRRATRARGRLDKAGLAGVYHLQGGIAAWQSAGLPTEGRG